MLFCTLHTRRDSWLYVSCFFSCHSYLLFSIFRLFLPSAPGLFWKLWPEVPQAYSVWLDSALWPARSRNWHEFRIREWKKEGGMNNTPPGLRLVCGLHFYFSLSSFVFLEFEFCFGFLSVLVAVEGQQQLHQCSSRSICSAGCVA